jgi:peptidyl-prolyl cis-trans isomerase SurA
MNKLISIVVGLIVFSYSSQNFAEAKLLDRVIAIVDESVVLESELVRRSNTIITQIKNRDQPLPPLDILRKQVLDRLIVEALQVQTAQRVGVRIGDRELGAMIERVAQGSKMSMEQFKQQIEGEGKSWALFREDLRTEIMIDRVKRGMVKRRIQVSEKEVDNVVSQMDKVGENRTEFHLGHILLALPESASPEELAKKREQARKIIDALRKGSNFEEFAMSFSSGQKSLEGGDLGWMTMAQIPTLFAGTVKNMAVHDVSEPLRSGSGLHILFLKGKKGGFEAKVVVQTNVRHILITPDAITTDADAFNKAAEARTRIVNGEDFSDVAIELSSDKSNAGQGGDMGWIDPGTFVPEFSVVMDKLEINELSQPVKTEFGWHLIEVLGRRDQDQTEERKRNRAYQIISNRKFEEESLIWISEMREKAHIKIIETE